MADSTLNAVITLDDQMSRTLKQIEGNVRGMQSGIDKSVDNVTRSFASMQKRLEGVGDGMQRTGKKMSLFLTAPIVGASFAMFKAAADTEEATSLFNTIFADLTHEARSWAGEYSKQIGRSRFEMEKTLSSTANLAVGFGMTGDEAFDLAKTVATATADLASFNNLSEDYARTNMLSALQGNHTAAVGLGAVLNENTLELAKNQMGIERNWKELAESEKVQVRMHAILMQNEAAMGDATRTANSTANQMKALRGRVTDLSIEMGQVLIPIGRRVIEMLFVLTDRLRTVFDRFQRLSVGQQQAVLGFVAFLAIAGPVIVILGVVIKSIATLFGAFLAIKKALVIATVAMKGLTIASTILFIKIIAVIAIITAVVGALLWLSRNSDHVRNKIVGAWNYVAAVFGNVANSIRVQVGSIIQSIQNIAGTIWGVGGQIFSALISPFARAQGFIGAIVSNIGNRVANMVPAGVRRLFGFASGTNFVPETGMYTVGERGPEQVILPRGSRVTRASDTAQNGGGGQNTITINVTAGMGADGREIADMIRRVINQDQRLARLI